MFKINEASLEWALIHLKKYQSSSFYPRIFEFDALDCNWSDVKKHILSLDLDDYAPKTPLADLALKQNKNFRIVHQMDPIDSLIYTSLIYDISKVIEDYRIPEDANISCSFRIKLDMKGDFFANKNGYNNFKSKTEELAEKYVDGYVLICDITDFYNQIYTHRIQNIISEAGGFAYEKHAKVIEKFILNLNSKTSRGIPVGPYPSIILSEAIMADIDKKVLSYSRDFVRYVDDFRIFFTDEISALNVLHGLTKYLYSSHRLVFSGAKTKILKVSDFMENFYIDAEKDEALLMMQNQELLTFKEIEEIQGEQFNMYDFIDTSSDEFLGLYHEIGEKKEYEILSHTYFDFFVKELSKENPDNNILKYILRRVTTYRINNLVPIVLKNFKELIPIIKEVIIYLSLLVDKDFMDSNVEKFNSIIKNPYSKLPYVNIWLSYLLRQPVFCTSSLQISESDILGTRDKALIAKARGDKTFIKSFKDSIDVLAPWDKRAIIFASSILSKDELKPWLRLIDTKKDILDKSLAKYALIQCV